jgi:hypothetical protein
MFSTLTVTGVLARRRSTSPFRTLAARPDPALRAHSAHTRIMFHRTDVNASASNPFRTTTSPHCAIANKPVGRRHPAGRRRRASTHDHAGSRSIPPGWPVTSHGHSEHQPRATSFRLWNQTPESDVDTARRGRRLGFPGGWTADVPARGPMRTAGLRAAPQGPRLTQRDASPGSPDAERWFDVDWLVLFTAGPASGR